MANEKSSYHKKWWVKTIRERNYFGFRYWWFNWAVWSLACLLLLYGIFFQTEIDNSSCLNRNNLLRRVFDIEKAIENCCSCNQERNNTIIRDSINQDRNKRKQDSIQQPPRENCRAFFSGRLVTDDASYSESVIFQPNNQSEYVGSGFYPVASQAFPNSTLHTFDGIALVAGTRIIIYEKKNFQGRILLDVRGPALINNGRFKNSPLSRIIEEINTKTLQGNLESIFPKSCRRYSDSDMHSWSNGSLKIICNQ
jgi:hypothetical protein